jgi:hypothetical protein
VLIIFVFNCVFRQVSHIGRQFVSSWAWGLFGMHVRYAVRGAHVVTFNLFLFWVVLPRPWGHLNFILNFTTHRKPWSFGLCGQYLVIVITRSWKATDITHAFSCTDAVRWRPLFEFHFLIFILSGSWSLSLGTKNRCKNCLACLLQCPDLWSRLWNRRIVFS